MVLSRTLVPVLFKYLMRSSVEAHNKSDSLSRPPGHNLNPFRIIHQKFEDGFERFRQIYRQVMSWTLSQPTTTIMFFAVLMGFSLLLFPQLGRDFFPQVNAGQMRLHVRTPPGTRLEKTQEDFAKVETAIRHIVGNDQIDVILDNIGLPYAASILP